MNEVQDVQNMDQTRGHKKYESKIKNLEGIFGKLRGKLDITKYESDFNQIQFDVSSNPSLSSLSINSMPFAGMQMDYESALYDPFIKKLDDLLEDVERDLLPFYELHLLISKIDLELKDISGDNIQDVILSTKDLIDALNSLNTHNDKYKKILIDKAYKTIYNVILNEEMFERSDILTYISKLNIPTNRENLGRLLDNDLKKLDESDLLDNQLRTLKQEGLGDDLLNVDVIRKVVDKTVGEKNSQYQERKRAAIEDLSSRIKDFTYQQNNYKTTSHDNNARIRNLYLGKSLLLTRLFSIVLIPIVTIGAGHTIGKNMSNKISEYSTITRTVDLNTGKVIGEPTEVYDEKGTTYVATIMYCTPWRANPTGSGYIRNVTAYEYIVPDDIPEDYHISKEDLDGNILEKYKFVEPKDELSSFDSTTESTILITETYQDKSKSQKSTKYIVPGILIGASVGLVLDILALLTRLYGYEKTRQMLDELTTEIQEHKLSNQEIKMRLQEMKEEANELQDEYKGLIKRYGTLEEQITFDEINPSLIKSTKKKIFK